MALDKEALKERIDAIQDELKNEEDPDRAKERFSELLATAIDEFVKTGEVTINGQTATIQ